MASKNLLAAVENVNNLEQKKAELKAKYKMEIQRMQDAASAVTRKLDTARAAHRILLKRLACQICLILPLRISGKRLNLKKSWKTQALLTLYLKIISLPCRR